MASEGVSGFLQGLGDEMNAGSARKLAQQKLDLQAITQQFQLAKMAKLHREEAAKKNITDKLGNATGATQEQINNRTSGVVPFQNAGIKPGTLPDILSTITSADMIGADVPIDKVIEMQNSQQSKAQTNPIFEEQLRNLGFGVSKAAREGIPQPSFDMDNPPQPDFANASFDQPQGTGQGGLAEGVSLEIGSDGNMKYSVKGVESTDEMKFLKDAGIDPDSPDGLEMLLRLKGVGTTQKQSEELDLQTKREDLKLKQAQRAKFEREEKEAIADGSTVKARFQRKVKTNLGEYKELFGFMDEIGKKKGLGISGGFSNTKNTIQKIQVAGLAFMGSESKEAREELTLFQKYKQAAGNVSTNNALNILKEGGQKNAPLAEFKAITDNGINVDDELGANYQALADLFQGTLDIVETDPNVTLDDASISELKELIKLANKKSNELAGMEDSSQLFKEAPIPVNKLKPGQSTDVNGVKVKLISG
jgi:hypothetical protein